MTAAKGAVQGTAAGCVSASLEIGLNKASLLDRGRSQDQVVSGDAAFVVFREALLAVSARTIVAIEDRQANMGGAEVRAVWWEWAAKKAASIRHRHAHTHHSTPRLRADTWPRTTRAEWLHLFFEAECDYSGLDQMQADDLLNTKLQKGLRQSAREFSPLDVRSMQLRMGVIDFVDVMSERCLATLSKHRFLGEEE